VSHTAANKFSYPTGKEGAISQGYDLALIGTLPDDLLESFCGVGNPFTLGPVSKGAAVLDVGCGAGFDLIVASQLVGKQGRVCGIDITQEMVEKARTNLTRAGVSLFDLQVAGAEKIPYPDETFDVVISNGVLNLSPMKERSFREIHRVLKSSGRLQFADIVLKGDASAVGDNTLEDWSN
jgi:arsenite methyltransferase